MKVGIFPESWLLLSQLKNKILNEWKKKKKRRLDFYRVRKFEFSSCIGIVPES